MSHNFLVVSLCLLVWFIPKATPLTALSAKYYEQDYITASYGQQIMIIDVEFDQDAYLSYTCPPSSGVRTDPVELVPCCIPELNITTNCFTPEDPSYTCVDNFTGIVDHLPYTDTDSTQGLYQIGWQIANPATCNGFAVNVIDIIGTSEYTLSVNSNILDISDGSQSSLWCCSVLQTALEPYGINQWDGTMWLDITSFLYSVPDGTMNRYQYIYEPNIGRLPMAYFWNQAQIQFVDDNGNVLVPASYCNGNLPADIYVPVGDITPPLIQRNCQFIFPPREDMFYNGLRSGDTNDTLPFPQSNHLIFYYQTQVLDFSNLQSTDNSLPTYIISLLNIVDENNQTLKNSTLPLTTIFSKGDTCSLSKFQLLYDEFVQKVDDLVPPINSTELLSSAVVDIKYGAVLAPVMSINWAGCKYYIQNYLANATNTSVQSNPTTECLRSVGTPEFSSDPCCNNTLLQDQCCVPRSVISVEVSYTPLPLDQINSLAPTCTIESLKQFEVLSYDSLSQINDRCPQISELNQYYQSAVGGFTDVDQFSRCLHYLERFFQCDDGQSPRACIWFGSNTEAQCIYADQKVSLTTSWDRLCTIPCQTDEDCVFAEGSVQLTCRIHGYYNNCETVYKYNSNFWQSPQSVDPMISCVAGFITNFDPKSKFKLFQMLGIPITANKTILDQTLKNYVITQGCSISYDESSYTEIETQCDQDRKCNWFFASNTTDADFNIDCLNPPQPMNPDGFCGLCSDPGDPDSSCMHLSQNGECIFGNEYAQYDLDQFGSQYLGIDSFSYTFCTQNFNGTMYQLRYGCMAGNYTQLANGNWVYAGALSYDGCVKPEFCPVSDVFHDVADGMDHNLIHGETCESYCYWDYVDQINCTNNGFQWLSWTKQGITYNKCIVPGVFYSHCDAYNRFYNFQNVKWWQGSTWFPPMYETPSKCNPSCRYNSSIIDQETCTSNFHCSNPLCMGCDQATCEASGICDVKPGCYIQYDSTGQCLAYDVTQYPELNGITIDWWPWGCRVSQYIRPNELTCQRLSFLMQKPYFYLSYPEWGLLNQSSCENIGWKYCEIPETFITEDAWLGSTSASAYNSMLDPVACQQCDAKPPRTKWHPGIWISSDDQWLDLIWNTRKFVPITNYTDIIAPYLISALINGAFQASAIQLLKSAVLCKEGNMKDILLQIACLAGDDASTRSAQDCAYTFDVNQVIAETPACSDLATVNNYAQFGTFTVTEQFHLPDYACIQNMISTLFQNQFQSVSVLSLSARLPMPSSQLGRDDFENVKNSMGVIVGKMMGNGVQFQLTPESNAVVPPYYGLEVCLQLSALQTTETESIPDGYYLWVGISDDSFTNLTPMDASLLLLNQSNENQICFSLEDSVTVFPIYLIENYEDITYISTFTSAELGMLIFGLVIYGAIIVLSLIVIAEHFYYLRTIVIMKGAAEVIAALLFSILRTVFWSMILVGVNSSGTKVALLFLAEMPALILFCTLSLLVSKLADIYHGRQRLRASDKRVTYVLLSFVIFLTVLLILVVILTGALPVGTVNQNCFTTTVSTSLNSVELVAMIYFVIFLIAGVSIIGGFAFYTLQLINFIVSAKTAQSRRRQAARALAFLACSASLSLLCQCFFLIVQAIQAWEWSPVAITTFLVIVDLHTLLLLLHYAHHTNVSMNDKTQSNTTAASKRTQPDNNSNTLSRKNSIVAE